MSKKTTRIRLACFDGEYEFQISLAGCIAIEEKAGVGIGAVYAQILRGRYLMEDGSAFGVAAESAFSAPVLLEIVRQGLIGGGKGFSDGKEIQVGALKANMLISVYLDPDRGHNLLEAWNLAAAVMHALIEGVEEAPAADPAELGTAEA